MDDRRKLGNGTLPAYDLDSRSCKELLLVAGRGGALWSAMPPAVGLEAF